MDDFVIIDDLKIKVPPPSRGRRALFLKHLKPYQYLIDQVRDRNVLDVGCGPGYGSFILSHHARAVTGVDVDSRCIDFGRREFGRDNLEFIQADVYDLPRVLPDRTFDLICALEFIEHLERPEEFLRLSRSLLAPKGRLFLTTPNRLVRSVTGTPWNPDHVQEFDAGSYRSLLAEAFDEVVLKGITGSERAVRYNRIRTGGGAPPLIKRAWRYFPEFVRLPIRKLINIKLPEDISLDDFTIGDEVNPDCLTLAAFCRIVDAQTH
jgi:SAM-dependent methyltransferase